MIKLDEMSTKEISLLILLIWICFANNFSKGNITDKYVCGYRFKCKAPVYQVTDEFECSSTCEFSIQKWFQKFIATNFNPCDDFYSFMCSKWIEEYPIPLYYNGAWNFNFQKKYSNDRLFMNKLKFSSDEEDKIHYKLYSHYYSCMEHGMTNENIPVRKLRDLLHSIGGFPVLGITLKENYKWQDALARLIRELDFNEVFVKLNVKKNFKNGGKNVITLEKGTLGDDRENILACNTGRGCEAYVKKLMYFFNSLDYRHRSPYDQTASYMNAHIEHMIYLEKRIASIESPNQTHFSYHLMTVHELQDLIEDKVNIRILLEKVFEGIIDIDSDTEIAVTDPEYLRHLAHLLLYIDNRTIANYIGWRVIQEFSEPANLLYLEDSNWQSADKSKHIERNCVKSLFRNFPYALAYYYLKINNLYETMDEEIQRMFMELKSVFERLTKENHWMDEESRRIALAKLSRMNLLTFGPLFVYDDELLNYHYSGNTSNMNYFEAYIHLRHLAALKKLEQITLSSFHLEIWNNYATQFVASYDLTTNDLYLPVGAISNPLYDRELPAWMKFGHIGTLMAREIHHAFDEMGSKFDQFGDFKPWWDGRTTVGYSRKKQCFHEQYNRYKDPITGVWLDAIRTFEENVADNVGLNVSYMAYRQFIEKCNKKCDGKLSFLDYSTDQLFFMTYALSLCGYHKPEDAVKFYLNSNYSPARHRIFGTLSNSRAFKEAFHCPPTSKIYNDKICSIW